MSVERGERSARPFPGLERRLERLELRPGLTTRFVPATEIADAEWEQQIELLRVAFNGGPQWFDFASLSRPIAPIDHLRWKALAFPGVSELHLIERFANGGFEIVGMAEHRVHRWLLRGRPRNVFGGGDACIHPSLQGQGLQSVFRDRGDELLNPLIELSDFGVQSHPTAIHRVHEKGVAKVFANTVAHLVRPLDLDRYLWESEQAGLGPSRTAAAITGPRRARPLPIRKLAWRARQMRNQLRYGSGEGDRGGRTWRIETVSSMDERADAFFREAARAFEFIQMRDRDYLNWRYCHPHAGPFVVRAAFEGDHMLGFAALSVRPDRADLADLLALPGRIAVARDLIADAVDVAREAGVPAVNCWMSSAHPYTGLLRAAGFLPARQHPHVSVIPRSLDPAEAALFDDPEARQHIVIGDTDHV